MHIVANKMLNLLGPAGDQYLRVLPMCVYVFSGTSGGTGSGILLDVLMTIDKLYTEIVGNPYYITPSVTLFLFGPDQTYTIETDPGVRRKKAMNGAACLYELDAFKRCTIEKPLDNHRIFNRFSGWADGLHLTSPFHFPKNVYYIDNTLVGTGITNTRTVSYKVMHDLAADFVFNLEVRKLNKFNVGVRRGDVALIGALDSPFIHFDQNNIDQNGFCQMFNTFVPLSVCFPKDLFSHYCSTRFNVDYFKALRERVNDLNGKKMFFKTAIYDMMVGLEDTVKTIFDNADKSRRSVADGIRVNEIEHCIEYDNPGAPEFLRAMAPVVNQAKNNIEQWIYTHFANMLLQEGVDGVIETVMACDAMLTAISTELKHQVIDIPQPRWFQMDTSYFREVLECIWKLISIEIYDYCSLGNDGVLDHVLRNLKALQIVFHAKIHECVRSQGAFIGMLHAEDRNPMRQYLPRLDTIVQDIEFVEGNEFERIYDAAFTEQYMNQVHEEVFSDAEIKQEILDIVRSGDRDKANGVAVAISKKIDELFSQKFANDQGIQNYANTKILRRLSQLPEEEADNYTRFLNGHKGALFPTSIAALNAHGHMTMVLANFNNDATIKRQYCTPSDILVDDAYFADRVVSYCVTTGFSINDIASLNQTYLPELINGGLNYPAFSDKRFDISPFRKDSVYEAMVGDTEEQTELR